MKRIGIWITLALIAIMVFAYPGTAAAQTPPDIIHSYVVTIDPQSDGSLLMKYDFDYEATTDFPSDTQYLQIGVPNTNFEIVDFSPKNFIVEAKAIKAGKSQVELDFYKLPKKGDRFKISFTIKQKSMIYKVDDNNVSFKFVPGWFDFAEIKELKEVISLKNLKVVKVEPSSVIQEDGMATFITKDMAVNDKAEPVIIITSRDSYPKFDDKDLTSESGSSGSLSVGVIVILVILGIVLLVIIIGVVSGLDGGDDDGYSGGGYIGGLGRGGGRSSGGGGSFSGRGSSCACVSSCACACACAGGGRVGCAERGLQVLNWYISHQKEGGKDDETIS